MSTRTLAVISAGLAVPSSTRLLADRLTAATVAALAAAGTQATVEVIELREHARHLADNLVTGFAGPALQRSIETVVGADGLIAVTPIFSASYSGLFKTFLDVLDQDALAGRPVLIGATAGSVRHSLALEHAMRPLFAYLQAVVVPTGVFAATEDWAGGERSSRRLGDRIERAGDELANLMVGRSATVRGEPAGPFGGTPSFDQLLRGV